MLFVEFARKSGRIGLLLLFATSLSAVGRAAEPGFDVVVYGGTAGGVAAAVTAARAGRTVVLIEPSAHLGGMTSGGLGATDIGNKTVIGGFARDFYRRLGTHYAQDASWTFQKRADYKSGRQQGGEAEMWTFEPHVAERLFDELCQEAGVTVLLNERLDLVLGATQHAARLRSLWLESGREIAGRVFIDASYEGDLMAKAGVAYHVGREANATYGESLNGVQTVQATKHQFKVPIDPFREPGNPTSGLLFGIHAGTPGRDGTGDRRVQAYNFRMCLTDAPGNRIPFPKPPNYRRENYELLRRYIEAGVWDAFCSNIPMPNRKSDCNNCGAFSTDFIGESYDYPEANHSRRAQIITAHAEYQQGLMYFLANDEQVPAKIRAEVSVWGLCRDEFTDNGGWPHQIYVREARRMISDVVMTQHHCQSRETVSDSVGMAAYTMDSHNVQRYAQGGRVFNEGDVQVGGFPPYPISYRAIVPREAECANLFVPVCLAASHIAYGSIRMEPVFMVLGESAALAADLALRDDVAVQQVPYARLRERLLEARQVLQRP
ncbi:MAG: FAD-dependent oxidoreductase [Planctomycetaceae bacterium]